MQKTAYEMRISYWSADVCSSDLASSGVIVLRHTAVPSFSALCTATSSIRGLLVTARCPSVPVIAVSRWPDDRQCKASRQSSAPPNPKHFHRPPIGEMLKAEPRLTLLNVASQEIGRASFREKGCNAG